MKIFNKISRILFKKNSIWILLLALFYLLGTYFISDSTMTNSKDSLVNIISFVQWAENGSDGNYDTYDPYNPRGKYYYGNYNEENLAKDLNVAIPKLLTILEENKKELDDYDSASFIDYEDEEFVSELYYLNSRFDFEKDFINDGGNYKYNISDDIFSVSGGLAFITFIISILFMSLEHLTGYYKFTQLFPWKNTQTYVSKVILASILILALYFGASALKYFLYYNSAFQDVFTISGWPLKVAIYGVIALSQVFIFMGLGAVSGNFLGHIGMSIIALGGYSLISYNLDTIYRLITDSTGRSIFFNIDEFISQRGDWLWNIVTPGTILGVYKASIFEALSIFGVAIVFLLLGYFWTEHSHPERTGLMIMRPGLSIYAEVLVISTTSLTIWAIYNSMGASRILSIGLFGISVLLVSLFYHKIFKIKIGI